MFRCSHCENYHDKSEYHPSKDSPTEGLCFECYVERYACQECHLDKEDVAYNKYVDNLICTECALEMESKFEAYYESGGDYE
ncbi:MAG: hypothetical protein ABFQ95_01190 [Pseudomonadota bacterium]